MRRVGGGSVSGRGSFDGLVALLLVASGCAGSHWLEAAPARARADGTLLAAAQRYIAEREYRASDNGVGLQAPNRAHNLRTYFDEKGIRLVDRTAQGSPELLRVSLSGVGREGGLRATGTGTDVAVNERRVEIRRPGLVEWYVNSSDGLEQGFTLAHRPAGDGPVIFEVAVAGGKPERRGEEIVFDTASARRLCYGQLAASDVHGRALAAHFEAGAGQHLRIVVDDVSAEYPITVDPLFTESPDTRIDADQAGAAFGIRVAGAGDVNGDGYSDVIVGALYYDAGQTDEGAAFVFLGSSGGITATSSAGAAAQLESDQAYAHLGSVASAGDVNHDGFSDVIVGADDYSGGRPKGGAAFLFLGSATGIADGNPTTAAARLLSDQPNSSFGASVAGAGDVNGDGYADVIIGAADHDDQTGAGAAFVFLGSATGIGDGGPATAATRLDSTSASFGGSVAGAGDVNGDHYADVIVGDYDKSFVFLGTALGIPSATSAAAATVLATDQSGSGFAARGAGDVNADGYADVIVGSRGHDTPGYWGAGAAYVFLGSATGIASGTPATAATRLEGDVNYDPCGYPGYGDFGTSVASAGDVDGDGFGDVIVGDPSYYSSGEGAGAAWVFLGSATGVASGGPATAAARVESHQGAFCGPQGRAPALLGTSVDGAGDVNGDGYADVIAGAPGYPGSGAGAAFVYLGGSRYVPAPREPDARIESNQDLAGFGVSLSAAGDVDGDGFGDVIVGAPYYDAGQTNEGAVFLFRGSASGIGIRNPTTAATQLESDQADAWFGESIAVGDVNGDGHPDVIVGAPRYELPSGPLPAPVPCGLGPCPRDSGTVFIFLGSATGVADGNAATAATTLDSGQTDSFFGQSVASAGDVNGDGYGDVIVGAYHYQAGESNEGAAFVFLGSSSGIGDGGPTTAAAQLESNQPGAGLGGSVAGLGDVNGDGYDDVIVGAASYDAGQGHFQGAAFVFTGSSAGITDGNPSTAAARLYSDRPDGSFGASVAGAGDVNGDGYADVIVGAPLYVVNDEVSGTAFVFHGSASGIADANAAASAARLEPDRPGRFGNSVAGAGDMNGDGFADVIVGAPDYDHDLVTPDSGAVYLYRGSATGLAQPVGAKFEVIQQRASFGASVAGAGDVNGDGYSDVIAGAWDYSGAHGSGAAFVYHGSALPEPDLVLSLASGAAIVATLCQRRRRGNC
jgi:hypothetical protein